MAPQKRVIGAKKAPRAKQPPLTHFLCLPLVTAASRPQLEISLEAFREDVSAAVHHKAIRPVGTLHCTLGVMSLDPQRLADATAFLESLSLANMLKEASKVTPEQDSASPPPLVVDLRGLVSMHPPQNTSILYAEPQDPTERLYPFCLALQAAFKERGFLVADDRKLKLHATIVNTIYAKGRKSDTKTLRPDASSAQPSATGMSIGGAGHGPNANAPLRIDAQDLIDRYGEHLWAEHIKIERISIASMGAKKVGNAEGEVIDECYTEVTSVAMPASDPMFVSE